MSRVTISEDELQAALTEVPPPLGHNWQYDEAASGDRIRLFVDDGGHVGAAYGDGTWFVEDPDHARYGAAAGSTATSLVEAMRRVCAVAGALGWYRPDPLSELGRSLYPVIIVADRYGGVYSGGEWLAFEHEVPTDVTAGDSECATFWKTTSLIAGIGDTPNQALEDLAGKLARAGRHPLKD